MSTSANDPDEATRELLSALRHFAAHCHVPRSEIDDLVQDVWLRVAPRLARVRRDHSPKEVAAWLYRVVHNQAIDHVRAKSRHPVRRLSETLEGRLLGASAESKDVLDRSGRRRLGRQILDFIRELLTEDGFRILHMEFVEGRSTSEIARTLGLTNPQVWSRKHRAMKKAREHFRALSRGGGGGDVP